MLNTSKKNMKTQGQSITNRETVTLSEYQYGVLAALNTATQGLSIHFRSLFKACRASFDSVLS